MSRLSNRQPLQVSPKFLAKLKDLQKKMRMTTGEEVSLRALTENIVSSPIFEDLEKRLLQGDKINLDVRIKMDRRLF